MLEQLAQFASSVDFIVKIVEAPHYRRYLMQHLIDLGHRGNHPGGRAELPARMSRDLQGHGPIGLAARGVNSGKGHLFISRTGDICPSGFLPLPCGNVRRDSIATVYREHPVSRLARSVGAQESGLCEYRRHAAARSRASR
jgi:MoaA/NifB/PqqE/SkfB family radical SAM enzyme